MKTENHNQFVDPKWFYFAQDDLKIVLALWNDIEKINRGICFHAQQYVEKIIKGLLEKNNIKPPRIHDLVSLNELCKGINLELPLSEDNLQFLSSVYIDTRYPPDAGIIPNGEPTEEHSELAFKIVMKLDKWTRTGE